MFQARRSGADRHRRAGQRAREAEEVRGPAARSRASPEPLLHGQSEGKAAEVLRQAERTGDAFAKELLFVAKTFPQKYRQITKGRHFDCTQCPHLNITST